jgi:hypothetical protein
MNSDEQHNELSPLENMCKRLGEVYGSSLNQLLDEIEKEQKTANVEESE